MPHLLLERLALQRQDEIEARARAHRQDEAAEPRTRRTAMRRLVRRAAWSPW
jgi:hypothetical protein